MEYTSIVETATSGRECETSCLVIYQNGTEIGRLWVGYFPCGGYTSTRYITHTRVLYDFKISSTLEEALTVGLEIDNQYVEQVINSVPKEFELF